MFAAAVSLHRQSQHLLLITRMSSVPRHGRRRGREEDLYRSEAKCYAIVGFRGAVPFLLTLPRASPGRPAAATVARFPRRGNAIEYSNAK